MNGNKEPQSNLNVLGIVSTLRLRSGNEEGQSLVEFSLCLPVMLLILTGIFAFGTAINNDLMLTNATSVAAMQLAISRGQVLDPCAAAGAAVYAAAPALTSGNLKFAFVLNGAGYSATTSGGTPTCSSASTSTGAAGNLVLGAAIQVTVTYPCSLVIFRANNFPNCLLTAKSSELVQ